MPSPGFVSIVRYAGRPRYWFGALLVLCCQPALLAQDSCSTSINPTYCNNCYLTADLYALGCGLGGDDGFTTPSGQYYSCTLDGLNQYVADCLAATPPPYPPTPTAASGGLSCAEPGVVRAGGLALAQRRLRPESNSSSSSCGITFLDPVTDLQDPATGNITMDPETLATAGREVSAAAADSATFVVLRIPAQNVGDTVTVTLLDENNQTPNPMAGGPTPVQQLGMLSSVDGSSQGGTQVQLTAERANGQVMAFAIYAPPPDFDRGPLVNPADDTAASRTINFQVTENGSASGGTLKLLRPPVVLIHGFGADESLWNHYFDTVSTSGQTVKDQRFAVTRANWSKQIAVSPTGTQPYYPSFLLYSSIDLSQANTNQLGLDYNAPVVLGKITTAIYDFRENAKNPLGLPAAASQADVVAHSMGGLLARWASRLGRGDGTYLANPAHPGGTIHKLITIGTPHFGSNWATQVLADSCFQGYYALPQLGSQITFGQTVTLAPGGTTTGALWDLQGNANGDGGTADNGVGPTGNGSSLSDDMQELQMSVSEGCSVPAVEIAGKKDPANTGNWIGTAAAWGMATACPGGGMERFLDPGSWNSLFNNTDNDAIVSVTSQLAGLPEGSSNNSLESPLIHTAALTDMGFSGPVEIDPTNKIHADVIQWLNAPVSTFKPL